MTPMTPARSPLCEGASDVIPLLTDVEATLATIALTLILAGLFVVMSELASPKGGG